MEKSLQWKGLLCIAVLAAAVVMLYPSFSFYTKSAQERETLETQKDKIISKVLNLGLDLKGGMHLILEVELDKILEGETRQDVMSRALEVIRNRVDQFGVAEPLITRQGERWIVVQLPGVKDAARAIDIIGKTALLEFKLVDDKLKLSDFVDAQGQIDETKIPEDVQILYGKDNESRFVLKKTAEITGAALSNAVVKIGGEYNMPYVAIDFNAEGGKSFARITEANVERNLAIVLDGKVQSAPVIRTKIPDGHAIIEGNFTMEEAKSLAIVLRAGALPAPVKVIENRTIGPTLGRDSIKAGTTACIIGLVFVIIFMAVYYGFSGIIADAALLMNLVLLMGGMALMRATLTMPGIAGIILTMGMAVDANVLIFERIREELAAKKTVRVAIDAGYKKAFTTILDSNLTTLIAAAFLFQFGTGPVKGFAVTLSIGIAASMFTAIIVTHVIFDALLMGKKVETLSI